MDYMHRLVTCYRLAVNIALVSHMACLSVRVFVVHMKFIQLTSYQQSLTCILYVFI